MDDTVEREPFVLTDEIKARIEAACALQVGPRDGVCWHGAMMPDGTALQTGHTACHAALGLKVSRMLAPCGTGYIDSINITDAEFLFSITQNGRNNEAGHKLGVEWFRYILGPNSPWRVVTKDFNPDPQYAYDTAIIIGDLDTAPFNVLYHFMIATRFAWEYPNALNNWGKYRDMGLCDLFAWLMVYHPLGGQQPFGHCAMPNRPSRKWVENVMEGTPARLDAPWRVNGNHNGANSTFGDEVGDGNGKPNYFQELAAEYPDRTHMARAPYSMWERNTGKLVPTFKSTDDLIWVLKQEQERYGLQ